MSSDGASVLFRSLLSETKDGEWGKDSAFDDSVEMHVIRGTDFEAVRSSSLAGVPCRFIAAKSAGRKALRAFDILIETAGGSKGRPTGKTVLLRPALFESASCPITCASFARYLRVDKRVANPEYVYWYLQHLYKSGVIETHQVQHTGIARFQFTKFADSVSVEIPPNHVQFGLVSVMSELEDRISLLRETNATLKAIAQALFKSWFIDFDPVRAKQQGGVPIGMDEAIAQLFPSGFEDSTLGAVPIGWQVRALDECASFLNGLALQKFPPSDQSWLPIIKIAQLRRGDTVGADRAGRNIKPEYIVQNGDVLFSWSGSLEVEVWCGGEGALNQHLFKVTSNEFPKWFYVNWTRHHLDHFRQIAASKATTMGHIQRGHLAETKVLVPSAALLNAMDAYCAPLLARIVETELQAQNLAELRDTLLPRLISGQLRLPQAEALLEEATA